MSGGSYNYAYQYVNDFCDTLEENIREWGKAEKTEGYVERYQANIELRKRFLAHMKLVSEAMHDVEWVDSADYAPEEEVEAIKKVLGEK